MVRATLGRMSAHLALERRAVQVRPGDEVAVEVTVTNTGTVVDAISLDVVGVPADWARVDPPQLRLLPGRRGVARLVLSPPRSSTTTPGEVVLGLRARCQEAVGTDRVEEALLDVLPFVDIEAELVPRSRTARGLRRASYVVAVDNLGNAPVTVTLDGIDPDQHLLLAVQRPELVCAPGAATFGTLLVRAQRRYWRGPALTKGFVATVRVPGEQDDLELPGSLTHAALVPQALPRLATRAALLGLGLARAAPAPAAAAQRPDRARGDRGLGRPRGRPGGRERRPGRRRRRERPSRSQRTPPAGSPSSRPPRAPTPAPSPSATAEAPPSPFSARLQTGTGQTGPFLRVAPDRELSLAGFVLQPNGDRGEMALLRNGVALVTARLGDTQVFDFPAPLLFGPASSIQLTVVCRNPEGEACDTAVLLTGTSRAVRGVDPAARPGAGGTRAGAGPDPGPDCRAAARRPRRRPSPSPSAAPPPDSTSP